MYPESERPHVVEAQLAFTRREHVLVDDPRRGVLRARTFGGYSAADPRAHDLQRCRVHDCSAEGLRPDLREHGFAHADLSRFTALQAALERVRAAGRVEAADAAEIRRRLIGRLVPLHGGGRLWVLYIAPEGFIMRRAGPNGAALAREGSLLGMNDHDAASMVHVDQDVEGTPLRQILRGAAPWLFHHESPTRRNRWSRLHVVNLWIGLEQATRPLALLDRRTVDRRAHQLRYGLPTEAFLRRGEDRRVNDIWTLLPDERQRWYFTSELDANTAYVFQTLSTPHGAFILPGEARAEVGHRQLAAAIAAIRGGDRVGLGRALAPVERPDEEPRTAPLRRAIAAIEASLAEARARGDALCRGVGAEAWLKDATRAAEGVVRKSLEMRAVAVLL